ncbi:SH3 domain-containing protein [Butyrivibrio sp. YAB3001]|uniref:SH3 domain-containing protein n=1 Tax=Butyrivibrio sp. YAB3001 TaxID=1520812 RepID=UPI0008F668FB|nr:SH3 domain-containing protein [Butyrivibrio sp. YAB3001]SFB88288.1 GDSL-like Lipase/Acylhydrolase [Butyrivibrio sp. YAB3001]
MDMNREKKRNLIILVMFAAFFSVGMYICFSLQDETEYASSEGLSSETVIETVTNSVSNAVMTTSLDYADTAESDVVEPDVPAEVQEQTLESEHTVFTVQQYDAVVAKYASDTVNVRAGAGTDYDRLGKVSWGTEVAVIGATDNGWYEVQYNDSIGFIRGDYVVDDMPGVPYLFVGDSRTVQLEMAIGSNDKAYIAKVGEGYSYFKNTAIPAISEYAGNGTTMIINFGVNDLKNASKYVKLINDNIDEWTNAGITVYYSAVTPVGSCQSVSNSQIESFNSTLKEGLDARVHWIDSYSYLQQVGFNSSDGLHYNKDTYKNLYSYYMAVISQQV